MYHALASIVFALGMFAGAGLVSCSDHVKEPLRCAP